jgi:hypothetical protein
MASERSEGPQPRPAVDPISWIGGVAARFGEWARRVGEMRVAWVVLAVAYAVAAVLILVWGKGQTFINDEWNYLVVFRGWSLDTMFHPQNGHLIIFPLAIYKLMYATVGSSSHLPYQVATVILHLLVATLFFLLVRTRVALAVAVALTILIVFFGAGWDTIMGAYEVPNLTGMAAGLGMLLALRRHTRGGDIAACVLLALSLASFSVGIAFALGALLAIALSGRGDWRRIWIVLVPAIPYVAWFLWARKFHQTEVTLASISGILSGIADQLAAICASITGLYRLPGSVGLPTVLELRLDWGYPLALVLAGLVVLHVRRRPRSIYFWTVAGTLLFYLALVAIGLSPARTPEASRYVYMGSILTLLLIVELGKEVRWSTTIGLIAVVLLGLSLMTNTSSLRAGARLFQAEGETNRAELGALELDRAQVDTGVAAEDVEETTHSHADMLFPIWAYFETAEESGSPAYDLAELQASGQQAREAADQELVRALEIVVEPTRTPTIGRRGTAPTVEAEAEGTTRSRGPCVALVPDLGRTATFTLGLPPGGFSYRAQPGDPVTVTLGRFAAPAIELPPATGSAEVAIPRDAVGVPWQAQIHTAAPVLACAR